MLPRHLQQPCASSRLNRGLAWRQRVFKLGQRVSYLEPNGFEELDSCDLVSIANFQKTSSGSFLVPRDLSGQLPGTPDSFLVPPSPDSFLVLPRHLRQLPCASSRLNRMEKTASLRRAPCPEQLAQSNLRTLQLAQSNWLFSAVQAMLRVLGLRSRHCDLLNAALSRGKEICSRFFLRQRKVFRGHIFLALTGAGVEGGRNFLAAVPPRISWLFLTLAVETRSKTNKMKLLVKLFKAIWL